MLLEPAGLSQEAGPYDYAPRFLGLLTVISVSPRTVTVFEAPHHGVGPVGISLRFAVS